MERWFARTAKRERRAVFLEDALFGGSLFRYAVYRLRFFFGRMCIETPLHIIEFAILAFIFSEAALVFALVFRIACGFAQDFWWGALECLRSRIRSLYRQGQMHLVPRLLPQWFRLGILCAATVMVLTVGWIVLDVSRPLKSFDPLHLFVFATALQLAISCITRTYHSAVYAIRRIYRPFGAIVGVQLCGFGGTLLLWPLIGVWGFPIMHIATTLLANALTVMYVRRVYRFLELKPFRVRLDRKLLRGFHILRSAEFFAAGTSYSLSRFDDLLILVVAYGSHASRLSYDVFMLLYLLRPLLRACYEWAQLFYFDMKRLELELFLRLKSRFERRVRTFAVCVGAALGILACMLGTAYMQQSLGLGYALIMVFFVVRAHMALQQIRGFAEQRYGALIATGVVVIAGMAWLSHAVENGSEAIALYVSFLVGPAACLASQSLASSRPRFKVLAPLEWVARLKDRSGPVRIRSVSLEPNVEDWLVTSVAQDLSRSVNTLGELTVFGRRIVWYESRAAAGAPSEAQVLEVCAGLATGMQNTEDAASGREALAAAVRKGVLDERVHEQWSMRFAKFQIGDITKRFETMFPAGQLVDVNRSPSLQLRQMPSGERREIMQGAIAYSRSLHRRAGNIRCEVTTLIARGSIRLIFAAPLRASRKARAEWRAFIDATNIACALGAEVNEDREGSMFSKRLKRGVIVTAAAAAIAGLWMMPVDDHVTGTFQLKPAERSEVRAPIGSFLRELNYAEGDWIRSGAIVGQLGVPHLSSRTASKLAEIEETKANLRMLEVGSRPEAVAMQRARVQLAETLRDRAQFHLNQALTEELQRMTKKIDEREAEVEFARSSYEKAEKLFSAKVIHQTHLERSRRDLQVYEAQYQQAVAERHARQASVVLQAQSELADREQYLADAQGRLSLMEAGTRQEEIDAARARLVRLTEELRYLEEAREQMVLRSAVTGMILSLQATELVGRYFNQGDLILEIGNPQSLTVEIELPEKQFSRVQRDDRVVLKAVALPYQTYETKVDRISPLVEAGQTGNTAKVYGRLERVDEMLVPGMSGYARIELGTRSAGPALLERFVRFIRTEFWW